MLKVLVCISLFCRFLYSASSSTSLDSENELSLASTSSSSSSTTSSKKQIELELPWGVQQELTGRAIEYSAHLKQREVVDLTYDSSMWAELENQLILGPGENMVPLSWVSKTRDVVQETIDVLGSEINEYQTNIALYDTIDTAPENGAIFASWLSTVLQRSEGIVAVRAFEQQLCQRQEILKDLHAKIEGFYKTKLSNVLPSIEGTMLFILDKPTSLLTSFLAENASKGTALIEKFIKDTFFPDAGDETSEEDDESKT